MLEVQLAVLTHLGARASMLWQWLIAFTAVVGSHATLVDDNFPDFEVAEIKQRSAHMV